MPCFEPSFLGLWLWQMAHMPSVSSAKRFGCWGRKSGKRLLCPGGKPSPALFVPVEVLTEHYQACESLRHFLLSRAAKLDHL